MDFINSNKEYDLVTMGEVMLRLSPPGTDKISQSYTFDKKAGGAELNVASGSAVLGIRSALITKLPENKIGHFIRNMIRYGNVSDDCILEYIIMRRGHILESLLLYTTEPIPL